MEQRAENMWRDNLNISTREEQHKYYGGEISEQDFDMGQHYNLRECALKTQKDMCAANPDLEMRWMSLELDWLISQHCKEEGEDE